MLQNNIRKNEYYSVYIMNIEITYLPNYKISYILIEANLTSAMRQLSSNLTDTSPTLSSNLYKITYYYYHADWLVTAAPSLNGILHGDVISTTSTGTRVMASYVHGICVYSAS
jgi:hypothetical protein